MSELKTKLLEELEERLSFETLLANLSSRFINLTAKGVDSEIVDCQRQICESLGIDRSTLWQIPADESGKMLLTHFYQPSESPTPPEQMDAWDFFPWVTQKIISGEEVILSKISDLPPEAIQDLESFRFYGTKSNVIIPLSCNKGQVFGLLTFSVVHEGRIWTEAVLRGFKLIANVFASTLERKKMERQLLERFREVKELRKRLEKENIYLREEIKILGQHKDIVGESKAIKRVIAQAEKVASTDATVLILGETGTGKELISREIHAMSHRKDRLLVTVNCASLPPTLIESELFGREKGAYTGALTRMIGRFEIAHGSTIFLDEIGDLPFEVQSKLLMILEQGKFERLGSTKSMNVDVRIIAATNCNLSQDVEEGKFRKDLYYRLNVFPITMPALRERREDIPALVWGFVRNFEKTMGKRIDSIPKKSMDAMKLYFWPGNVRELRNVIERAMIMSTGRILNVILPATSNQIPADHFTLEDMERRHILDVLERTNWRISGKNSASEILDMKRTTLQSRMKLLGITRPVFS